MFSTYDGHQLCSPFFPHYAIADDFGEFYRLSEEAWGARYSFWYEASLH